MPEERGTLSWKSAAFVFCATLAFGWLGYFVLRRLVGSVWLCPMSAFGVAAVFLWGWRIWPILAMAGLVVQVPLMLSLPFWPGVGYILCLLFGPLVQAYIITLVVPEGANRALLAQHSLLRFFFAIGPLGGGILAMFVCLGELCMERLVASTWLLLIGRLWLSFAVGTLLIVPVSLLLLPNGPVLRVQVKRKCLAAYAVLFALVATSQLFGSRWEHQRLALHFQRDAQAIHGRLLKNLSLVVDLLRSMGGFIETTRVLTRSEFQQFGRKAYRRHPWVQALEWIPRVKHEHRSLYERRAREDGITGFQLTERKADGRLRRAGRRGLYFPVYYLVPRGGNEAALGFDLASDLQRRDALLRASRDWRPVATQRVRLVQGKGSYGFLVFVPVAISGSRQSARRLRGYILGVFRIQDVIKASIAPSARPQLLLRLSDVSAPKGHRTLFRQRIPPQREKAFSYHGPALHFSADLPMAGRTWRLSMVPTNDFFDTFRSFDALFAVFVSFLLVSLMGTLRWVTIGHAMRADEFVRELKSEVRERKSAEYEARQASLAKSAFLANMSHELRTPLNAIIGFSEILSDELYGSLNNKQKRQINHIHSNGYHLLELINEILDLAKIESGQVVLQLELIECEPLLRELVLSMEALLNSKQLTMRLSLPEEPLFCRCDAGKFKQIVLNLLSNAVKFSEQGQEIHLSCSVRHRGSRGSSYVRLVVRDEGIGLDKADLERIFESFEQVDSSFSRQEEGTGLGLALTRRFVELHHGKIRAFSEGLGLGSTFTVELPVEPPAS